MFQPITEQEEGEIGVSLLVLTPWKGVSENLKGGASEEVPKVGVRLFLFSSSLSSFRIHAATWENIKRSRRSLGLCSFWATVAARQGGAV